MAIMIDHTNLSMQATKEEIEILCQEAMDYHFKAVCVRSSMVAIASRYLRGSDIQVCSVVGFPTIKTTTCKEMERELCRYTTDSKVKEAQYAINAGASEIDMVINLRALKQKEYNLVEDDIKAVVTLADPMSCLVKVIIETCYLTDEEKVIASKIVECAGAQFVKTSTGYGPYGATLSDMELMSKVIGEGVGIKASGGIHTLEAVLLLYKASQRIRSHNFRVGSSRLKEPFNLLY